MNNRNFLILGAAALLLFGAACGLKKTVTVNVNTGANENQQVENENGSENLNDRNVNDSENKNVNTNTNSNVNDQEDHSVSGLLSVSKPEKGEDLESPFAVEGKSAADTVYVSVKSGTGVTLFTVPVTVRSGAFKASLTFTFTHTTDGTVVVFEKDAGGNMTNAVTLSVTFKTGAEDSSGVNANANSNANDNANDNENENTNSNENTNNGY